MIITPFYYCRKLYSGNKLKIANPSIKKLVSAARYILASKDHVFWIEGKTFISDLHQCNAHKIGLANFIKLQIETDEKKK
jgi:hypothetical protein